MVVIKIRMRVSIADHASQSAEGIDVAFESSKCLGDGTGHIGAAALGGNGSGRAIGRTSKRRGRRRDMRTSYAEGGWQHGNHGRGAGGEDGRERRLDPLEAILDGGRRWRWRRRLEGGEKLREGDPESLDRSRERFHRGAPVRVVQEFAHRILPTEPAAGGDLSLC